MNMTTKVESPTLDWKACNHCLDAMPYRALVPIRLHAKDGPMLFQVAGSSAAPCGAEKALRSAMKVHGGTCFYCGLEINSSDTQLWTLDHIEPSALGGKSHVDNLVVACKDCNLAKGHKIIDSFNPTASKNWLQALALQIEERIKKIDSQKS